MRQTRIAGRLARGLTALLLLCATAPAQANPLKGPKRIVEGQTVDLTPLFRWWNKHEGERPLSSWRHINGPVVDTNAWGWVVTARVETSGSRSKTKAGHTSGSADRIILKNPPLSDRAEFDDLLSRLKPLEEQRSRLLSDKTKAKNRIRVANDSHALHTRAQARAARQARYVEKQADEQLAVLDKPIKELRAKLAAFPNPDHYQVDCLALDTGVERSGVPVFDHGVRAP